MTQASTYGGGTANYMSPEICQQEKHCNKVDIWAIGIILFYMLSNSFPFEGSNDKVIYHNMMSKPVPQINNVSTRTMELIKNLLRIRDV